MMGWYDNDMGAAGWVFMIAAMMIFWGDRPRGLRRA